MGWTERLADSRSEHVPGGWRLNELALVGCLLLDGGLRNYTHELKGSEFRDPILGRLFAMLYEHPGPIDAVVASNLAARAGGGQDVDVVIGEALDFLPLADGDVVTEYVKWIKRAAVERRVEEYRRMKIAGFQ